MHDMQQVKLAVLDPQGWPKQGDMFIVYGDGHGEVKRNGKNMLWHSNYKNMHQFYRACLQTEAYYDSLMAQ